MWGYQQAFLLPHSLSPSEPYNSHLTTDFSMHAYFQSSPSYWSHWNNSPFESFTLLFLQAGAKKFSHNLHICRFLFSNKTNWEDFIFEIQSKILPFESKTFLWALYLTKLHGKTWFIWLLMQMQQNQKENVALLLLVFVLKHRHIFDFKMNVLKKRCANRTCFLKSF